MKNTESSKRCPWRETGVWLMGDTHVHHRQEGLERVVDMAASHQCDFLAFTEHSFYTDHLERQPDLIKKASRAHPDMILVNGTEWSTPIGNDQRSEQVGLLFPTGPDTMPLLYDFLSKYDTKVANIPLSEDTFLNALRHLGTLSQNDLRPLVILTHPHHPEAAFTLKQIQRAIKTGPALVGLCASSRPPKTGSLEIWPWAQNVGGICDQLFANGSNLVILAESHFHKHLSEGGLAFWPGEFRRNYIFCPTRTEAGLFAGLKSGISYFTLGDIISNLQFNASTNITSIDNDSADNDSIMMGESLSIPAGTTINITISFKEYQPIESVELIGNPNKDIEIITSVKGSDLQRDSDRAHHTFTLKLGSRSCYLRIRGSAQIKQPYPLKAWFYTNPLWLNIAE